MTRTPTRARVAIPALTHGICHRRTLARVGIVLVAVTPLPSSPWIHDTARGGKWPSPPLVVCSAGCSAVHTGSANTCDRSASADQPESDQQEHHRALCTRERQLRHFRLVVRDGHGGLG